jgi:hypothetical protein
MTDRPDWEPDPESTKVALSDAVLLRDGEDSIPPDEYIRRQKEAEERARSEFIEHWEENGLDGLQARAERLSERMAHERKKKAALMRKRCAADRAAEAAQALAEKHGEGAECREFYFVEGPTYEHGLDDGQTVRWRRSDGRIIVVTEEDEDVFAVALDATFGELREGAEWQYRHLESSWRKRKELADYFHFKATLCQNVVREVELYGEPERPSQEEDAWTAREGTTERAVQVLSAYNDLAHEVEEMGDLRKLLQARGYDGDRSTLNSLLDAARRHGVNWEDGSPDSYIQEQARALDDVGELPTHLQELKTVQDSCG